MKLPKLLAVDLDGTLLCAKRSKLSVAHQRCIKQIQNRGIEVALVTGRPLLTAQPIWQQLNLKTPLVCFNGAWLGLPDQEPLFQHALPAEDVQDIVSVLREFDGSISAYPNAYTWCMHEVCPTTADWPHIYQTNIQIRPEMFTKWSHTSPKVLFACNPEIINDALRAIKQQFGNRFHAVKSQEDRFEVQQPVHKAIGLAALANHLQIPQDEVWAVGDAANDIEMLDWAGVGLAMGHAPHQLKQKAQFILPGINAHGMSAIPNLIDRVAHEQTP